MSHPAETKNPKAGTGVAEQQNAALPQKSNRGAGTAEIKNAGDAQGNAGAKSKQTEAEMRAQGTTGPTPPVQSTEVKSNYVPGAGSPTQNRRAPDVMVSTKALGPTPKKS